MKHRNDSFFQRYSSTEERLDVGPTSGGIDPVEPAAHFTLLDSGIEVFNSAGQSLGSFGLSSDTSTATGLSGVAVLGNGGQDIYDMRVGGIETAILRINLDLAIGQPRTTFGIFNDGPEMLTISSIIPEAAAPWISWTPEPPFDIQAGELQVISIIIDYASAPGGASQSRLLINSNDPENPIYPGGVFVNVTASDDRLFFDGFED
jgi:hypothetical protein